MGSKYEQIERQLKREKQALEKRLAANEAYPLERSLRDADGELSLYDNHPADNATTLYDREKDIAILEHEKHLLDEISNALERISNGQYGVCKKCGKTIELERLKAVPTTVYCKEHQPTSQYKQERPVEEEVLTGFAQFNYDKRDDETEFDAEDAYQAVARFNELPSTNYDDLDSEEARGYVEPIEGFIITDMYGNTLEQGIDVNRNRAYEDYLNQGEGYGMIWEDEIIYPDEQN